MNVATLFDVQGRVALVTGGSGGIGYMIAEGLTLAGVEVWICSRKEAEIDAAAARLLEFGKCHAIVADLGKSEGVQTVADKVLAAGPLHILVNNAGATWGAPIEEFPRSGFEKVLTLNVTAPFELTKLLLPALRKAATRHDPARVINIASVDGLRVPIWESYPYSASKAALIHLTRHLGKFLAKDNIAVNAIAPGLFPSKMSASVMDMHEGADLGDFASPLGQRAGTPEDIVGAVIYLSSRAGSWLTGVTLLLEELVPSPNRAHRCPPRAFLNSLCQAKSRHVHSRIVR
jgi:NAD(P)-dependent dehydrogenase (short-subunit alcohol dehydrogenase family)